MSPRALLAWPCALLLGACSSEGAPSVLLVTLDTTRADRIGCYGRAQAGTPSLDALARRGLRYERAWAPVPLTLPAHTSLMTGTSPRYHGVRDNGAFEADERLLTLAEILRAEGHRSAAILGAYPLSARFGLGQGFERYDDDFAGDGRAASHGFAQRRGGEVVERARSWLRELEEDERFFLWAHLFDPHADYAAPGLFASQHEDPYQAEIAYADACVGALLRELEALGRSESTLVVVTADHGESLGEHGERFHGYLVHEASLRVPLLLAGPGVPRGEVSARTARLEDVAPSVLELCGLAVPDSMQGTSLLGALDEERDVYFESHMLARTQGWSPLEGVVHDGWKLVQATGAPRSSDRLYELASDPRELVDRAASEPERLAQLRARLDELRHELEPAQPFEAARSASDADRATLAALGYSGEVALEFAAAVDPRDAMQTLALYDAGRLAVELRRLDEAQAALQELERLDPGSFASLVVRGMLETVRGASEPERLELALGAYERALALTAEPTDVLLGLAEVQRLRGARMESLRCSRAAARHAPDAPGVVERYEERLLEAQADLRAGHLELSEQEAQELASWWNERQGT